MLTDGVSTLTGVGVVVIVEGFKDVGTIVDISLPGETGVGFIGLIGDFLEGEGFLVGVLVYLVILAFDFDLDLVADLDLRGATLTMVVVTLIFLAYPCLSCAIFRLFLTLPTALGSSSSSS